MSMDERCPLPVDWLDFLENRPSPVSASHLDGCPSCKALLELLRSQPSLSKSSSELVGIKALAWQGEASQGANPGDLWLCHATFDRRGYRYENDIRLLVVLISASPEVDGERWC